MTDEEMNSLYNHPKVKAMVSFTKGEGFGRPLAEFGTTGKPIIASNWSGHLDFLSAPFKEGGKTKDKKLFAKVDFDLAEIPKSVIWKDVITEGSSWAYPKEKSFKKQLRNVYKNHGMYKKWAKVLKGQL